jgi:transcriptional regulator with XRE-family HTH domain
MKMRGLRVAFGKNVRRIREEKQWSQEHLAEISGLHRTYISGIERGIRNPTLEIVELISKALGVTSSRLVEEREGK